MFRGGVSVAAGDIDGDGRIEIVTGPGYGGAPHIRAFTADGRLIISGFFAYDTTFRGGVNVACADVNNDGIDEIITAPGRTGGPHIKVFNNKGRLLYQDFFAFNSQNTSGVLVSGCDIDRDGKEEILAQTADLFGL